VASIVFGLIALGQLVRLAIRPEVLVGGHLMPLWPSMLAFVILGGLSLWMWNSLARRLAERDSDVITNATAAQISQPLTSCCDSRL
jgi:hypothetical protein